jgi:hypothetical protein
MFNEIYFWMVFYLKKVKTNDTPAFNGYLILCMLQIFNFGTVWVLINYFFIKVNVNSDISVKICLFFGAVLCTLNYFLFYARRELIFLKYNCLKPKRKVKGQIFFWIYSLLSFAILLFSLANFVKLK